KAKRDGQRVEARREVSGNACLAGRELDTADVLASKAHIDAVAARLRASGMPGSLDRLRALALTDLTQGRDPLDRITPEPAPTGPRGPPPAGPPGGPRPPPRPAGGHGPGRRRRDPPPPAGPPGRPGARPGPGQPHRPRRDAPRPVHQPGPGRRLG